METFTVRGLREHSGTLIHDAEKGKLSVVTKRGKPVFLAIPFNEELIQAGLCPAIAVNLYKEGILTLEKSAKFAGQSIELFMERLSNLDIPTADYPAHEIQQELEQFV
jgi:predicted HTH domain antitoxin